MCELGGVALVVLYAPGVPVQAERMDEMDLRTLRFE
jgi:hypothetical protein